MDFLFDSSIMWILLLVGTVGFVEASKSALKSLDTTKEF